MIRVENRTGLWIVQHPRERFHPIGTARIATCGLTNVHVQTAFRFLEDWPDVPSEAALLFPSPDAPELSSMPREDRPRHLVVVDGTWANAAALVRDLPWLARLRRCRIEPAQPGNYRIRKEPTASSLSTIEAIVQALMVLEPETEGLDRLIASFDAMIDQQIEVAQARRGSSRRRGRPGGPTFLPRALASSEDVILVHGESISTPGDGGRAHHRELVQWAAVRVSTGLTFEGLVRPEVRFPTDAHLRHMGIEAAELRNAADMASMRRGWRAFVRPGEVIATMHQDVMEVGAAWLGSLGTTVALKTAYENWRRHPRGGAHGTSAHELPQSAELPIRGRAGEQLAKTLTWLRPLLAARRSF